MATVELTAPTRSAVDQSVVVRAVTVIMGTVVGLTFLFGFGNVLTLALRLGVPVWVAPLVATAVAPSILGLLPTCRRWHRCRGDGRGLGHQKAPKHRGIRW